MALEQTCTATQLIERLYRMVEQHGDLPVYADDADTDWRLPIGLMHKSADAAEEWPERLEIKTSYHGRPKGDFVTASPAERVQMTYETNPRNVLPNGLTLLQVNPDCAVQLDPEVRFHGWLFTKGSDGQWVSQRKLSPNELEEAYDQAADMVVKHGTKVRAG